MVRALGVSVVCTSLAVAALASDKGTPEEAKALLQKAVAAMEADQEAALAAFADREGGFVDRDLYVFCFTSDGDITAHIDPSLVGQNARPLTDPDGLAVGEKLVAIAQEGGGELEYKWQNPVSGEVETKVSYLARAGDQTCGVGAYK
jgi:signal transduction histidine kinase